MSIQDNLIKGIIEYIQLIQSYFNEITLFDSPLNWENLTLIILNGIGDIYKEISTVIQA